MSEIGWKLLADMFLGVFTNLQVAVIESVHLNKAGRQLVNL